MENEAARQDMGSRIETAAPVRLAMGERLPLVQRSGGIKVEMQGAAEEFSLVEEIAKHLVKGRYPRCMDTWMRSNDSISSRFAPISRPARLRAVTSLAAKTITVARALWAWLS
jgi:hypothetical protein